MPEKLHVGLAERSYPIWIGAGIWDKLPGALAAVSFPRRIAVVTNPLVAGLYLERLQGVLSSGGFSSEAILLPDGEEHKSLATLETIFDYLIENGFDRHCGMIALGGGVIGDMTGFAAATYLRGVPFVQVPTTLLAQVDSSVGGKTAVNHPLGKNLIGAFYQPRHVQIDVTTLESLAEREFAAGLAEVVKYGVIRDRSFFDWLVERAADIRLRERSCLIEAVARSCKIKADVVEIDEKEDSLRAILNFGHTFGHAVETLSGYGEIKHGEAVSIGMVVAAEISRSLGLCSRKDVEQLRTLLASFRLPVVPPDYPLSEYLRVMGRDKKVRSGVLRMVLNRGLGDCEVRDVPDPEALLAAALKSLS